MSPANLGLRFVLELAALAGIADFAWRLASGPWRIVLAAGAVAAAAALWTVFAVPGDPSRSGHAPVAVPGVVRLALEWLILFGGAWAFQLAGNTLIGIALACAVVLHYLFSAERIIWLLRQQS